MIIIIDQISLLSGFGRLRILILWDLNIESSSFTIITIVVNERSIFITRKLNTTNELNDESLKCSEM